MTANVLDQLIGMSKEELELLRELNDMGAASADELAIQLDRAGEDITPVIENLLEQRLLQVKHIGKGENAVDLYMTNRKLRELL